MMVAGRQVLTLERIREAVRSALAEGGARRAILFGSYARGEADVYSDIDLIIVADTSRPFVERFKDFPGLWRALPGALDVLVYTPEELQRMVDSGNPFVSRALDEGIVVYEARP